MDIILVAEDFKFMLAEEFPIKLVDPTDEINAYGK